MAAVNTQQLNEKLLDGWERGETGIGIPYYMNHKSERTQWDHPLFQKLCEEFSDYDTIRYSAYRSALKVRFLQKRLQLDKLDVHGIKVCFDRRGLNDMNYGFLDCRQLDDLMSTICIQIKKSHHVNFDSDLNTELLVNLILNLYDIKRNGSIRVIAIKTALAILCSARLSEKYKYFFTELSDNGSVISRKKLGIFLKDFMQIVEMMKESELFGGMNVGAAVNNCFENCANGVGIHEEAFLNWMFKEPQTVVWLPMLHRLTAAETVEHNVKCKICKIHPIIGIRYRCLKCFNFDMCQNCFLTGKVGKNHKIRHPTQEYCSSPSSKEGTKAVLKTIKNNISKKYKRKEPKPMYLPIPAPQDPQDQSYDWDDFAPELPESDDENVGDDEEDAGNDEEGIILSEDALAIEGGAPTNFDTPDSGSGSQQTLRIPPDERRELESVIMNLEDENKMLLGEIEHLHDLSISSGLEHESNNNIVIDTLRRQREHQDAKLEILESHNKRLQNQIDRLKKLVLKQRELPVYGGMINNDSQPPSPMYHIQPVLTNNFYHAMSTPKDGITFVERKATKPQFASPIFQSPGVSISPAAEDFTWESTDSAVESDVMSRTRFVIPSTGDTQYYPEEEAEIEYLIEKLRNQGSENLNGGPYLDRTTCQITGRIAGAMTDFVTQLTDDDTLKN